MALFMVANDLKPQDVSNPAREIAFPESVISLFKGELGFPPDGFPKALEHKVLRGEQPMQGRAGDHLPPVDLAAKRVEAEHLIGRKVSDTDLASYLMYGAKFRPRPDSGEPERAISKTYAEWAYALRLSHPKTSELLNYMSERYNRDAEWQDTDGIVTKRLGKY